MEYVLAIIIMCLLLALVVFVTRVIFAVYIKVRKKQPDSNLVILTSAVVTMIVSLTFGNFTGGA